MTTRRQVFLSALLDKGLIACLLLEHIQILRSLCELRVLLQSLLLFFRVALSIISGCWLDPVSAISNGDVAMGYFHVC